MGGGQFSLAALVEAAETARAACPAHVERQFNITIRSGGAEAGADAPGAVLSLAELITAAATARRPDGATE